MYTVCAIDRQTCETTVENYAVFYTYNEAREFADRYEMEARACGWTFVVRQLSEKYGAELMDA